MGKKVFYEGYCTCNSYNCVVKNDRSDHQPLSLRTFCRVSLYCNLYDQFEKNKRLTELLKDYSCYQLKSFDGFKEFTDVINFHQPTFCTTCRNNESTIRQRRNSCTKERSKSQGKKIKLN